MKRLIWGAFIRSAIVRAVSLGLVFVALAGSAYVAYDSFSKPVKTSAQIPVLQYQQIGRFDYTIHGRPITVYSPPPMEGITSPGIFTKLIDSILLSFSYDFVPEKWTGKITEEVSVVAVVEALGLWKKEIILVPETTQTGDFVVNFPLDLEAIKELVRIIDEEIGIRTSSHHLTIVAEVNTLAKQDSRVWEDTFLQVLEVKNWEGNSLELGADLSLIEVGAYEGLYYRQHGRFDYNVRLIPNAIYGAITMSSGESPGPKLTLKPPLTASMQSVDWIDVAFSHEFKSDKAVENLTKTVEISALLEDADGKLVKSIALVPATEKEENFSVSLLLDPREYKETIETTGEELGITLSPKLSIKADVWTSFETEIGPVNETFSQTMSATLSGPKLEWNKELTQTDSGSRSRLVVTDYPEIENRRLYSTIAAGVFVLAFLYLLGNYTILILSRILTSRASPEYRNLQVEKKRKDIMVNITELPSLNEGDTVIGVNSLDDLVRVSDSFIKPVLRKAPANATDPCVYYVIDGSTRYEYQFIEEPPFDVSQEARSASNEETPDT